ncbi:hypothetical protein [Micromonospora inyonensis]|uniref:Uncharacterized protein n=1 Tax=Micromonospora inyonensis TaxID=47866 RepID=A0A1C6SER3_9ACTN|nr:hypothetical protein [Micromonospora inyonensis]SCL28000.1 hypothetical protein GA0074694_4978 [Micromonospora inyonensis]
MRKLAVLVLAATFGTLSFVSPASAAPADSGSGEVRPTLVQPGQVPKVDGPTYYFGEGATTGQVGPFVDSLPFNYTFDVSWGLESRRFTTTNGKVCTWLAVDLTSGSPYANTLTVKLYEDISLGSDIQIGSPVPWPYDGQTYHYCWTPVTNNRTYYFWFGFGSAGNGAYAHGSGTATNS